MVVGADGTLAERSVAVGMRTATQAEIRSGLNEGDLVVVGDRGGLHPGDRASPSAAVQEIPAAAAKAPGCASSLAPTS